ncbi:MAG TPA: SDR family oxidoreductase [Acidimicrobiales bacterium]|jgi:glucose 1-dehydrogenase|nr:SDR family oxidoreductase [Acidimicrobiales bacterium]
MTPSFAGEVALVTGASGGMGRAISVAFAAAGASVVLADVDEAGGAETGRLVRDAGAEAVFVRTDVSDAEEVAAMVDTADTRFGRLDCAVNAAAIENESVPLHECEDDAFDLMQRVNLRGLFLCMKHELRVMLAGGRGGAIVNIASTNSFRPQPNQPAYTASKHGVLGLTRSAAVDYSPLGIRINAICPGGIDTPMLRAAMARRGRDPDEVAGRLSLLGRFGRPDEIAGAVLWLCSDAASYTVGHPLAVDAGYLTR